MRCVNCDKEIGKSKTCPYCGTYNETSTKKEKKSIAISKYININLLYVIAILLLVALIAFLFRTMSSHNYSELQNKYDNLLEKYNNLMSERDDLYKFYTKNKDNDADVLNAYSALSESEKELLNKSGNLSDKYRKLEDNISELENEIDSLKNEKSELNDDIDALKEKIDVLKKTDGIKKGSKKRVSAGEYVVGDTFPKGRFKITSAGSFGNVFSYDNYYDDDLNIIISNESDYGIKEYTHDFTIDERVVLNTDIYIQKVK